MNDRIQAILERGSRAKAVLDNETVTEALDHIADQMQRQWRATAASQAQYREDLFHQIAAIDSLRGQLKAWVDAAKIEQDKLDKANQRRPLRLVR